MFTRSRKVLWWSESDRTGESCSAAEAPGSKQISLRENGFLGIHWPIIPYQKKANLFFATQTVWGYDTLPFCALIQKSQKSSLFEEQKPALDRSARSWNKGRIGMLILLSHWIGVAFVQKKREKRTSPRGSSLLNRFNELREGLIPTQG